MRLLRTLAPVTCVAAMLLAHIDGSHPVSAGGPKLQLAAQPGEADVLYAAPGDLNYSYGPKGNDLRALTTDGNIVTATITVTYNGFSAPAQAAFQAAVNIWANTIVSPVPIRIVANWTPLASGVLGSAGPTVSCTNNANGVPGTFYAAALADKLQGTAYCAALGAATAEINANFNSTFTLWDFGTSGTGVPGQYNFMTVVLHEVGHGLGFFGGFSSSGGVGNLSGPYIYDRFTTAGAGGSLLLNIARPSAALHAQLTSDNTFWNGSNATNAKVESANFTTKYGRTSDNGWLQGSSYSHVDDTLYSGTPNGLMTWQLAANEAYTDPGPIMRGMFKDEGWALSGSCTYALNPTSASVGAAASTGTVALTTQAGCAWTASSANTAIAAITSPASGTGSATISYSVIGNTLASQRSVVLTIGGQSFTITQSGTAPTMSLDKTALIFGAVNNGVAFTSQTGAQAVRLTQTGAGTVTWTAASTTPWLLVSPTSGSGSATLNISVQFAAGLAPSQAGSVTLTFTGAGNTAGPITVTLKSLTSTQATAPTGAFDTPADGSTGVTGSIPVTGWAVDDVQVTRVRILRDPVAGETPGVLVFIGDAVLVDGARPDIQALFPNNPRNTFAGWGYLMLTPFLPNIGNGTFRLTAIADDADGHSTTLGTKTITCTNSSAIAPFGAIDTPTQGGTATGASVVNFGWVLSPGTRRADPPGGGTVRVVIDGVIIPQLPAGWTSRSDLSALFPAAGFSGIGTALGAAVFNSTTMTNAVHTISWLVTDNLGSAAGIGSRYFTVTNGALYQDPSQDGVASNVITGPTALTIPRAAALRLVSATALAGEVDAAPVDTRAINGRHGYDLDAPLHAYSFHDGMAAVQSEELDRIELKLSESGGHTYTGYLRVHDGLAPLPIGSALDAETGAFTWQPGVAFVGSYDLVFVRWSGGHAVARQDVRVVLNPKGSGRVGPQTVIDLAKGGVVAGWAADLDSGIDSGVDTVHVWAYPTDGRDPIFVGAADYGGARPDVAAIYGERFLKSGYGLSVRGLAPGTYDLAVFAYSTVKGGFVPAKTVRVTIR